MSTLDPERYYSLNETRRYAAISSRELLSKHIQSGHLLAIQTPNAKKTGLRYKIKGEWIMEFNRRYALGLLTSDKSETTVPLGELKTYLANIIFFCRKEGITTIEQLEEKLNNIK